MNYPAYLTPISADVNCNGSGNNTIVAAVSGKIIRVLHYVLVATTAVAVTWESSGGTVLAGPMSFATTGGAAPPANPTGHFDTLVGEGLVLVLGGNVQVGGHIKYVLI